jgi:hypothetical protein
MVIRIWYRDDAWCASDPVLERDIDCDGYSVGDTYMLVSATTLTESGRTKTVTTELIRLHTLLKFSVTY